MRDSDSRQRIFTFILLTAYGTVTLPKVLIIASNMEGIRVPACSQQTLIGIIGFGIHRIRQGEEEQKCLSKVHLCTVVIVFAS